MFHVPERYRIVTGRAGSNASLGNNGAFRVDSCLPGRELWIIASDGADAEKLGISKWEHVSVHVEQGKKQRTPTWDEMCQVKDLFWDSEDVAIQIHPARSDYVNNHAFVLHLWRPVGQVIPLPESIMVGVPGVRMSLDGDGNIVVEDDGSVKEPRFYPGERNPRCPVDGSAMVEVSGNTASRWIVRFRCNDCGRVWSKDYSHKKEPEE